jgi:hypothetical protein
VDPAPEPASAPAARNARARTRGSSILGPLAIAGTGIALMAAFFPLLFNQFLAYDDEGALLLGIREFIHRGSLYHHSSGYYGPFYYSAYGAFYSLLHTDPTPFSGRLIVLVLTGIGAGLFAATVYRVTHSLAAALLCEVASFCTLVRVAGNEPTHPASLIIVLIALLLYCLASNSLEPRPALLVVSGFATGAILLTKVNVGAFVLIALAIWLLVGDPAVPSLVRVVVIAGSAIFPFILISQHEGQLWAVTYALVVAVSILLLCAVTASASSVPNNLAVMPFAAGAALAVVASCAWPLVHGTTPGHLLSGVFIRPINQANALTVPVYIKPSWPLFIITLVGVALAARWRDPRALGRPITDREWVLVLGLTGLTVLGIGSFGSFLSWLPLIVLVPALAFFVTTERTVSSILVLAVAVAILQSLHAYPVAGSQIAWSTVAMFLPCAIAVGLALHRSSDWQRLATPVRATATFSICAFLIVGSGLTPAGIWHNYLGNPPLRLPGTSLVRLDPSTTKTLRETTRFLRQHCDTFYSAPPSNSFYIFTKIPSPTGLTNSNSGIYNTSEQLEIADALNAAVLAGKRVCIVREANGYPSWAASTTGTGPLGAEVRSFGRQIGAIDNYSVWIKGR